MYIVSKTKHSYLNFAISYYGKTNYEIEGVKSMKARDKKDGYLTSFFVYFIKTSEKL